MLGPNGSGKTTLLRAISGILPYSGELKINDIEVSAWKKSERAKQVAVVKQTTSVQFDFSALDFILLGRLPHKRWLENTTSHDRTVVENIIQTLELEPFTERLVTSLSGGERQRVLLAQALAQEPTLLLLDEPTTHLDIYHQLDLMNRIRKLTSEGKTIIAVFHDLSMASRFTDNVLILEEGKQVSFGNTKETLTTTLIKDVFNIHVEFHIDELNQSYIHYTHTN